MQMSSSLRKIILIGFFVCLISELGFGQDFKNLNRLTSEFYKAFNNNEDLLATVKGDSLLSEIKSIKFPTDTNIIKIQLDVAFSHYLIGNYNDALKLYIPSKNFFEKEWDPSLEKYDELLNVIARCYESIGDYQTAIEYFDNILKINEKKHGYYHQYSMAAYTHIAVDLDKLGKYREAVHFHDKAIEIAIELYGENHEETLSCLSNKALNLRKSNDLNSALKLNTRVMLNRKRTLGQNHPDYLLSLYNTAELQSELGFFDDANENFKICIESFENQFGIQNSEYINYLSGYAVFLGKIGSFDTALMHNKKCLQLFHETHSSNLLDYMRYLNNLGTTYISTGNPAFAKIYIDSALQLSEQHLGIDHPYSIQFLENISGCYGDLGDYNKAIDKEVTCLERIATKYGASSLEFASGLNQLAYYDSKLGIDSLALKWNKRAYEIRKEILGKDHPLTISSLYNLSVDYSNLNLQELALESNFEVLKYRTKMFGENHQFTKEVYNNIGLCYSMLKDYPNALKYYLKCENGDFGSTLAVNLSSVYEKLGQWTKAIEYQEKAVSWYLADYFKNQLYLSDAEKAKYKRKLNYYTSYLVYLNYRGGLITNSKNWYNNYISSANLINNGLVSNRKFIKNEDKEKLDKLITELQSLRIRKNKLIELNSTEELSNINNRIDKLEAQYSSIVGNPTNEFLNVEMIKDRLNQDDECFVEIVPFTIFQNSTSAYLGVVTQKEGTSILVLDTSDYISAYRKLFDFSVSGERVIMVCTSGNLSISQGVIHELKRDLHNQEDKNLHSLTHLYDIAHYIGDKSRQVQARERTWLEKDNIDFKCKFILGGQIKGEDPQLFLIYPQGNHIQATKETPFLQIGETKYGKPILDRTITYDTPLEEMAKCALLSIDSTMKSNISVGPPIYLSMYEANSLSLRHKLQLRLGDPYLAKMRKLWEDYVRQAFEAMPNVEWHYTDEDPKEDIIID